MHARGNVGRHVAQHRALDRADVGDGGARREMRTDLRRDRAAGADRHAEDDEIGAFDRGCVGLDHLIGKPELGDAPARGGGAGSGDDRAHGALRARRARDRRADQAHADQCQAIEDGLSAHLFPKNSASAATTSRLASSLPTVMRSAFGSL